MKITETTVTQSKKQGTKNAYQIDKTETRTIDREQYDRTTGKDTQQWFRRIGGSETAAKSYTSAGYLVTRLVSTSPDKETKITRTYKFACDGTE